MRLYICAVAMTVSLSLFGVTIDAVALSCSEHDSYNIDHDARTVTYRISRNREEDTKHLLTPLHFESFKTVASPMFLHWAACRNPYALDQSHVYYEGLPIPDVRPKSFKSLGESYFSDEKHIVYGGKILNEADAQSFTRWHGSYYRDHDQIFYRGQVISADGAEPLGKGSTGYFKNKKSVYFQGTPIDVDLKTFQIVGERATAGHYTKDKTQVYYHREAIGGADPDSFRWVGSRYYSDDASVYINGEALANVKPSRFQIYDCNWGKDDRAVYDGKDRMEQFDPATFEVLVPCDYTKDKSGAYYRGAPIEGAQPASFEVLKKYSNFSRDRTSLYQRGSLIAGVDPSTFRLFHRTKCETDDFFALDSVNVYYRDFSIANGVSPDDFGEKCLLR